MLTVTRSHANPLFVEATDASQRPTRDPHHFAGDDLGHHLDLGFRTDLFRFLECTQLVHQNGLLGAVGREHVPPPPLCDSSRSA
jgi:hypothetical protein